MCLCVSVCVLASHRATAGWDCFISPTCHLTQVAIVCIYACVRVCVCVCVVVSCHTHTHTHTHTSCRLQGAGEIDLCISSIIISVFWDTINQWAADSFQGSRDFSLLPLVQMRPVDNRAITMETGFQMGHLELAMVWVTLAPPSVCSVCPTSHFSFPKLGS